jgi:hypothetical protein
MVWPSNRQAVVSIRCPSIPPLHMLPVCTSQLYRFLSINSHVFLPAHQPTLPGKQHLETHRVLHDAFLVVVVIYYFYYPLTLVSLWFSRTIHMLPAYCNCKLLVRFMLSPHHVHNFGHCIQSAVAAVQTQTWASFHHLLITVIDSDRIRCFRL